MLSLPSRAPVLTAVLLAVCAVESALTWLLSPLARLYGRAEELDNIAAAPRTTCPSEDL